MTALTLTLGVNVPWEHRNRKNWYSTNYCDFISNSLHSRGGQLCELATAVTITKISNVNRPLISAIQSISRCCFVDPFSKELFSNSFVKRTTLQLPAGHFRIRNSFVKAMLETNDSRKAPNKTKGVSYYPNILFSYHLFPSVVAFCFGYKLN